MDNLKFKPEDVSHLREAHRYPIRSYYILDCLEIEDDRAVGDWNWSHIYVPRDKEVIIPVLLGPDVAETYEIKEVFSKKTDIEPQSSVKFKEVTGTFWLIDDKNHGNKEERIGFQVILERLADGETIPVDPTIVNE